MAIKGTNYTKAKKNDEVKYEVLEECGTISERGDYKLKLRYMKWNDGPEKYDLRPWTVDEETGQEKCGKGITMSGEELVELGNLIKKMEEED